MNRTRMALVAVTIACGACGNSRKTPASSTRDTARAAVPDSLASIKTLVDLLRAQLTSRDPIAAENVINCEETRLYGIFGMAKAETLVNEATRLADAPADDSARRRVESTLTGHLFFADQGCDSLAKTGLLGGPEYPKGAPPP